MEQTTAGAQTHILSIQQIKRAHSDKYAELMKSCRVFWAFSNQQFEENKTPKEEGEKYVSMGAGGFMPKSQVQNYLAGSKEIAKWYKDTMKANKGARRANIAYELANHESYYTGDITDALSALGSGYTKKEVWKVYHEEKAKQEA